MAVIFYFSGTGNSLNVANKLGKELAARVEGISAYLRSYYNSALQFFLRIAKRVSKAEQKGCRHVTHRTSTYRKRRKMVIDPYH